MLAKIKIYLIIFAVIALPYGGWKVRGWYEGNKEKEVIEKEIQFFNDQTIVDHDKQLLMEIELDKYKTEVDLLRGQAYELNKGICDNPTSYNTWKRLYNEAIKKANKKTTE